MVDQSNETLARSLQAAPTPLALLQRAAVERPEHPALIFMRHPVDRAPRSVTYRELLRDVEAAIAVFRAAGLQESDSVAVLLPSIPEGVVALIAATAVGVAFPVNTLLSSDALVAQLTLARTRVAVTLGPHPALDVRQRLAAAVSRVPGLRTVLEVPIGDAPHGAEVWEVALRSVTATAALPSLPDRVAALFHTGGTTGEPKLAQLSGRNMAAAALMMAAAVAWRPDDRILCGLPLFHVAGAIDVILGTVAAGATLIFPSLLGARDPEFVRRVWSVVDETKATLLGLVPTSLAAVIDTPLEGAKLTTLRAVVTGGSALSPQLARRIEELAGRPVCQVYGMTETAGLVTGQPFDGVFRDPAVGFAPPLLTLSIRKPDGSQVTPGEVGEVHVHGPNVFKGYLTSAGTAGPPSDGWVASGDLGRIEPDGQLRLLGRSKEVIIRGGHNIDPAMIEESAYAHPDVRQAGAVSMPDAYAGELPVLYVALRPQASCTPESIAQFVAERIAEPPAKPKRVFILPELPLTPLGKIARFKLRQAAAELKASELLLSFAIDRITCVDPAAKRIDIAWRSPVSEVDRAHAASILAEVGLTPAP